jgi:hypothetical protein
VTKQSVRSVIRDVKFLWLTVIFYFFTLNTAQFSLQYQAILVVQESYFALSDLNANTIESFLAWIFKLMEAFGYKPSNSEDNNH